MSTTTQITATLGDGIGPEIINASLRVLAEAGAGIEAEQVDIGEAAYRNGHSSGVSPAAWESMRRTRLLLKSPTSTPRGGRLKSAALSIRKALDLYANVRPCISYHPWVPSRHPSMNLVLIHENEEDLYAGIEYRQVWDVAQCSKLVTRDGCERMIRYAFEYAIRTNRRKLSCFTKSNILKMTDGMFLEVFETVGSDYSLVEKEHRIVDVGFANLATRPEDFEVIALSSVYGDILSDIAAQLSGSVGMAASAAIGNEIAMFEAIHGSAPKHAGRNTANPSGMLLAALTMLAYVGKPEVAELVHRAWLRTLEDGLHTRDISNSETTREIVGTAEFADAVIARLGQQPRLPDLPPPPILPRPPQSQASNLMESRERRTIGVDLYIDWPFATLGELPQLLQRAQPEGLSLQTIFNRGIKVWPDGFEETHCVNHWSARFLVQRDDHMTRKQPILLLERLSDITLDVVRIEWLYNFGDVAGYYED